jgi:hypothetical protein
MHKPFEYSPLIDRQSSKGMSKLNFFSSNYQIELKGTKFVPRIPALLIKASTRPKASQALCTTASMVEPPVEMSSSTAMARGPSAEIRAVQCLSDGLVARLGMARAQLTEPSACRAGRADVPNQKTIQNLSKFYFFQNFTICNQIHQKIIMFIVNSLHSGHSGIKICNQIHTVITNQESEICNN